MASPVPSLLALAGALATPALAQSPAPVTTTPRLTGYVQARFQSIGDSAVFFLRRVRLGAQGISPRGPATRGKVSCAGGGTARPPRPAPAPDPTSASRIPSGPARTGRSKPR